MINPVSALIGTSRLLFFRVRSAHNMPLTTESLNPALKNVEYAVRGELAIKAEKYRIALKEGKDKDLPFKTVISSNIGNPQQPGLDQPPITFGRQVCCAIVWSVHVCNDDVLDRLGRCSDGMACPCGTGAECLSQGRHCPSGRTS